MPRDIFSGMPDLGASPQFSTAEYAVKGDVCRSCKQAIGGQYYRVNGAMTCPACADNVRRGAPQDSAGAFGKALMAGGAAGVAGLVLYATVGIITGWIIGYVSLAVGFMVGRAMMKASGGMGGKRYQIAALLFTYAAVSLAAVPIYISQAMKHQKQVAARAAQRPTQVPSAAPAEPAAASGSSTEPGQVAPEQDQAATTAQPTTPTPRPRPSRAVLIGKLLMLGLASPFLELQDPIHGVIGLVILLVGLQMAWKITAGSRKLVLDGPFDNAVAARA